MNIFGTEVIEDQGRMSNRDVNRWPGYNRGEPGSTSYDTNQQFAMLNAVPLDTCAACGQPVAYTHRNNQHGYAHVEPSDHRPQLQSQLNPDRAAAQTSGVKLPLFLNFVHP